jgi:hypothetical protein
MQEGTVGEISHGSDDGAAGVSSICDVRFVRGEGGEEPIPPPFPKGEGSHAEGRCVMVSGAWNMNGKQVIANQNWDNFHWPEWVPDDVKTQIMGFWGERCTRCLADYIEGMVDNNAPLFGLRVRIGDFQERPVEGRFVYAWNNVARVVDDEGNVHYCGIDNFEVSRGMFWQKPLPQDYCTFENWMVQEAEDASV